MIVDGLVSNASIATYTANEFNSLEVAYASGNAFIITGFGTASVLGAPVNFPVPVELVDADGDAAAATLGVTLLPPPVSDVVDGGAGADTMYGLAGDDAYFVDNFADTVFENAGEGTDTVYSTAHFRLSDNVENLILQGAADLQGYGNGLSNPFTATAATISSMAALAPTGCLAARATMPISLITLLMQSLRTPTKEPIPSIRRPISGCLRTSRT